MVTPATKTMMLFTFSKLSYLFLQLYCQMRHISTFPFVLRQSAETRSNLVGMLCFELINSGTRFDLILLT